VTDPVASEAAAPRRRPAVVAALLLGLAALALWASSRMTWVTAYSSDGLGADRTLTLDGGTWAASLTPLALVLVAAIAASFAVRGWALRIVAVAVAAVGIAAGVPAVGLLGGGADPEDAARIADLPVRATVTATDIAYGPAVLALAGAVAALAAAVVLWRTPRSQAGLSSKYDSPAARREAAARGGTGDEPVTERALWDALDAGEDPTLDTERGQNRGGDADPAPDENGNQTGSADGGDDSGTRR
jgi:uncharacterized membrane protein (TIGR02234 family)